MYSINVVRNAKEKANERERETKRERERERRRDKDRERERERLLLNPHLKCVHIPQPILHVRVHY